MPLHSCRVCGSYMLPTSVGRPPATCGEPCRLEWKAARQKALRAREKALTHLAEAISALEGVNPRWAEATRRHHARLSAATPLELAMVSGGGR